MRSVADSRRSRRVARDLVGGSDAADEGATGREPRRDLHENGGKEGGGRDAVLEARVEVSEDTDGEGAERVGYLGVGGKAFGGKVVDDVPGKGDDDHDRCLFPFRLVDDDQTHGEWGYKDEGVVRWESGGAGGLGRCILIEETVNCGAYGYTKTEKEGVDDCVNHSYRTGDDRARLKLQGAAYWMISALQRKLIWIWQHLHTV